jgi:small-conductance mechanosensitive channel
LSLCAQARELEGRLQGRDSLKVRLEDVQRKLKKFEEAHHADVLKAYQRCSRQEREVNRQFDSVDGMVSQIRELSEELAAEDVPDQLFDAENEKDAEALAILSRLHQAIETATKALKGSAEELTASVNRERQSLPRTSWQKAVIQARADYEKLVRELKDQGVADPSEYGQLVQERQRLENQWKELESLEARRKQVLEQAKTQSQAVLNARRALSERREAFLNDSLAGNEYVQISLKPYRQDARAVERGIRELLGTGQDKFQADILIEEEGQPTAWIVAELLSQLPDDSAQARQELERRIADIKQRLVAGCQGQGNFGGHFNNFLERQASNRAEFIDHVMMWFPDDGLDVKYSQKGDGRDFKAIEQASAGQRAAAMLAFLLAHGSEPIVLDQPEDDLDNHLIALLVGLVK